MPPLNKVWETSIYIFTLQEQTTLQSIIENSKDFENVPTFFKNALILALSKLSRNVKQVFLFLVENLSEILDFKVWENY